MEYFISVQNRLRRASRRMLAGPQSLRRQSKVLALKLKRDDRQGGAEVTAMSVRTRNLRISKGMTLACAAVALGAICAQDALSGSRNGSGGSDGGEIVITVDQKPAFLAYVRRHQMHSDLLVKHVSVGDILPDSGLIYYDIPLPYGAPFYRCVVIGEQVVIADPNTGRVIQVVV